MQPFVQVVAESRSSVERILPWRCDAWAELVEPASAPMDGDSDILEKQAREFARSDAWQDTDAEQVNRRLIELDPCNTGARTRLGRILCETGRIDEAKATYKRCLDIAPDNRIALNALERLDESVSGRSMLEEARIRFPTVGDFIGLMHDAITDPIRSWVDVIPPPPTAIDKQLVQVWTAHHGGRNKDSVQLRMLSARLAEKAVASFYRARGRMVEDVSIAQVAAPTSTDWKICDLKVDHISIDVKNARRSPKNPHRYVRHCVPQFKETRTLESVHVAGTLSDWQPLDAMESPDAPVLFLGIVTSQQVALIKGALQDSPLAIMLRDGLSGLNLLPPWIFTYPERAYQNRARVISRLRELDFPDWRVCREANVNPIPAFLAAGRLYEFQPELDLSGLQRHFVCLLLRRGGQIELSLPLVYASVLEQFVRLLTRGFREDFRITDYSDLIFPTEDREWPFLLYDPLKTVDTLLSTLAELWNARTSGLADFKCFRLQELNALVGKHAPSDPLWVTLMAYCGGWIEEPKLQPCGKTPLVFGQCRNCTCGKLICPDCDYCMRLCPARSDRKRAPLIDPPL